MGRWVERELVRRGHSVRVVDPVEAQLPLLNKPQFAYAQGAAPGGLDALAADIAAADAFVMVSPEYNHSVSPALANTLNHFGSSLFSFKPSGMVVYSQGQWGGARAAMAMRPLLSELGCLPVSAMVQLPYAHKVLDVDGRVVVGAAAAGGGGGGGGAGGGDDERWREYFNRMASQVEWWGEACRRQRAVADPFLVSPAFARDPSQRNAP